MFKKRNCIVTYRTLTGIQVKLENIKTHVATDLC